MSMGASLLCVADRLPEMWRWLCSPSSTRPHYRSFRRRDVTSRCFNCRAPLLKRPSEHCEQQHPTRDSESRPKEAGDHRREHWNEHVDAQRQRQPTLPSAPGSGSADAYACVRKSNTDGDRCHAVSHIEQVCPRTRIGFVRSGDREQLHYREQSQASDAQLQPDTRAFCAEAADALNACNETQVLNEEPRLDRREGSRRQRIAVAARVHVRRVDGEKNARRCPEDSRPEA